MASALRGEAARGKGKAFSMNLSPREQELLDAIKRGGNEYVTTKELGSQFGIGVKTVCNLVEMIRNKVAAEGEIVARRGFGGGFRYEAR